MPINLADDVSESLQVWGLKQVSLDDQVRDLLKQRQFNEAVRLAEESVADGSDSAAKGRLATVHAEAGFLLLFDLQFELAMDHFLLSDTLQPSELFPFFPTFTTRWRTSVCLTLQINLTIAIINKVRALCW